MNKENIYHLLYQDIDKEDFKKAMWYLWKNKCSIESIYPNIGEKRKYQKDIVDLWVIKNPIANNADIAEEISEALEELSGRKEFIQDLNRAKEGNLLQEFVQQIKRGSLSK